MGHGNQTAPAGQLLHLRAASNHTPDPLCEGQRPEHRDNRRVTDAIAAADQLNAKPRWR